VASRSKHYPAEHLLPRAHGPDHGARGRDREPRRAASPCTAPGLRVRCSHSGEDHRWDRRGRQIPLQGRLRSRNGTAPLPVGSGNRQRHRLCRSGNRQLNAALHRIAVTQARHHGAARDYLARRRSCGNNTTEALRSLKRRLSDVVYHALLADAAASAVAAPAALQPVAW